MSLHQTSKITHSLQNLPESQHLNKVMYM